MNPRMIFLLIPVLLFPSCSHLKGPAEETLFDTGEKSDVILQVTPIRVKEFQAGAAVDAIAGDPRKISPTDTVVLFKIERAFKGEFTKLKTGGPSRFAQAKEAVQDKDFLKVLTLDFKRPDEVTDKGWLSVLTNDIGKTFGMPSRDNPGENRYKVYLRRIPPGTDSYSLVKVKRIQKS